MECRQEKYFEPGAASIKTNKLPHPANIYRRRAPVLHFTWLDVTSSSLPEHVGLRLQTTWLDVTSFSLAEHVGLRIITTRLDVLSSSGVADYVCHSNTPRGLMSLPLLEVRGIQVCSNKM